MYKSCTKRFTLWIGGASTFAPMCGHKMSTSTIKSELGDHTNLNGMRMSDGMASLPHHIIANTVILRGKASGYPTDTGTVQTQNQ